MTVASKRQKRVEYLKTADEKRVKTLYAIVEDEINTQDNDWDDSLKKELDSRRKSFLDGTAKTYTWEETKQMALEKVKSKKK